MKELKFILILYILSLPFTSAFAISAVESSPILLSSCLFSVYLIGVFTYRYKLYTNNTFFLFLWFTTIILSFSINNTEEKSINHLVLYILTILCLYWAVRNVMLAVISKDVLFWNTLLLYLSIIVFITSLYGVLEFIFVNHLNININNYIPHTLTEYNPTALGYIRVRSFIEESGHFAFFLEALAPLSIYYILSTNRALYFKIIYVLILFLSLLFTFSSLGFSSFLITVIIFLYYYYTSLYKKFKIKSRLFLSLLFIILGIVLAFLLFDLLYDIIGAKLQGTESYEYRSVRIANALNQLHSSDWLLGFGPGSYSTLNIDSYISVFVNILMDSGIFGLIFFIIFLAKQFTYLFKIKNNAIKVPLLISLSTTTLHYFYIGNYYYPWYWFLLAIIYTYYSSENEILKNNEYSKNINYNRYI